MHNRWLLAGVLVALVGVMLFNHCRDNSLVKLGQEAVVLDSTAVHHKRQLKQARQHTDSVVVDTAGKKAVKAERQQSDSLSLTDSLRIVNLSHQVSLLQPPRLKLFAQVDYKLPQQTALIQGDLNVEAGLSWRVGKSTWLYGSRVQPLTGQGLAGWHVGGRTEWRIF